MSCNNTVYQKSFPSDTYRILPLDRSAYTSELMSLLQAQLGTINTLLDDFIPGSIDVLVPPNVTYTYPDTSGFADGKPQPLDISITMPLPEPVRPDFIDIEEPDPPDIPPWTLGDVVLDLPPIPDPVIPDFTADAPPITYPPMPDPLEELRDIDLPIINPISIPNWMEPVFPTFDATLETVELVAPPLIITPGDNLYLSQVKDAVEAAVLDAVIHGGTGLAPEVETAIFMRESERALQAHNDRLIKLRADWLKGHYPLPNSMLYAMISEAEIDYTNKRLDTSRDISIEQAKLAQANTHFFVEKALAYEQMMIGWFNNIAQRVFEASKATQDASIEIYKASIQVHTLSVEIWKAKVNMYEVQANVALKTLEAIRIKLEAAKTTAEINRINVEVYKGQVETLRLFIEHYRAELEASKTYLEVENLKLSAYKTEVEAYGIRVKAASDYYAMYGTRIEAEKAKVQAYAAGADAYGKRVQAVKAGIDADTAFVNAQSEVNKSLAEVFKADASVYKTKVDAEVAEAEGMVKIYEGQVRGYEAESKVLGIIKELELDTVKTKIQEYKVEWDATLEATKIWMQEFLDMWTIKMKALETEAQVVAQVASASMNSDSITTHMSESYTYGEQRQESCQTQYYYDETTV